MAARKKREPRTHKTHVTYRTLVIDLPAPLWSLMGQLQRLINMQLRQKKKQSMNLAGVASLILLDTLLKNGKDIQDEYDEVGLRQLAVRLAPIIGSEGLEAAGFPEGLGVPDRQGPPRRGRPYKNFL